MEFAPHSNGLLKANTRELEFIAGTKLIENKIGCRRVRVPNVDDVAARRILGVMGVAPQVLQVPSGLQKRACHCPVCDTYRRLQRAGFAPTHPTAQCFLQKSNGNSLSRTRQGATRTAWQGLLTAGSGILEKLRF